MAVMSLAERLAEAFGEMPANVRLSFSPADDGDPGSCANVVIDVVGDDGRVVRRLEESVLVDGCSDPRFDAFLIGSARAFAALVARNQIEIGSDFYPHDLLVDHALTKRALESASDFEAALASVATREALLVEKLMLEHLRAIGRESISGPEDAPALALLCRRQLALEEVPIRELAAAVRHLAAAADMRPVFASLVEAWLEEYDPFAEEAWPDGPKVAALLAAGAYRSLASQVDRDADWWAALVRAVDRLPRRPTEEELSRAGF